MIPINFFPSSAPSSLCAALRCLYGEQTANWKATHVKNGLIDSSINRLSHPGTGHLFALIIASTQKFMDI